ncbi:MAG: T9SS type A sorting domain-containing protein, partial [bacterium]
YRLEKSATGSSAILLVGGGGLKDGEEIGVWTQEKRLVGSGIVRAGKAVVAIWGDDEMTEEVKEGAVEGEALTLTLWSGKERTLIISTLQNGLTRETEKKSLAYKKDGVWIANNEEVVGAIPTEFALEQNYPNPFNPSTVISFSLPQPSRALLEVFDVLGRKVMTLINKEQLPGVYKVEFVTGELSSGVYYYRLVCPAFAQTKKMLIVR